ncbi:unnamed protein product [Brassicogethes aeneus]|uniref:NADP-dependent oxidoreductase domain-containing protein n=1 Tax=Brassicogethes aeneus TaxID=1431903 RepID=A0A9P0AQZ3_BRAAE|nr:unnamed protein product [Brassicogethes aeneus]
MAKNLTFKLKSGDLMPLVGFGTYQIHGEELIRDVLDKALGAGYRLIDTAKVYHNENEIGKALKELLPKYNLTRKDIFITSKLSPQDQGDKAYEALQHSVHNLDCEYLDLFLIHWPGAFGTNSASNNNSKLRDRSWELLVQGVKDGLTKNIGVSNYNVKHMRAILQKNHGIIPAVNQVEWHPHYHQADLKKLVDKEGILLQAYSSLGGTNNPDLLTDKTVVEISKQLGKTSAQVLLRWSLQQNIAVIPKASSQKRIEENIKLDFVIPEEDMQKLSSIQFQNKYAWDPDTIA